jgi:hypothetical protein
VAVRLLYLIFRQLIAWLGLLARNPVEGCRHDSAALRISGALDGTGTQNWIGDKGYIGIDAFG